MTSKRDQYINDYLLTATGHLQARKAGVDFKQLAAYGTAAGSALALMSSAEAAVQYSGLQNITLTITFSTTTKTMFNLDIDNSGGGDIVGYLSFFYYSTYATGWADFGFGGSNAILNGSGNLKNLSSGYVIGAGGNFSSSYNNLYVAYRSSLGSSTVYGTWPANQSGFAGMRFTRGGNTHYAWVRLEYTQGGPGGVFPETYTAIDWAYEDCPDTAIDAGATSGGASCPAPVSADVDNAALYGLSALAAGALGLGALRRRRKLQLKK